MKNQDLIHAVTGMLVEARSGEQGLTDKYVRIFTTIVESAVIKAKLDVMESLQCQLDRTTATLEKYQDELDERSNKE
jgi:hypothetical protein